jgi:hypothetical protein
MDSGELEQFSQITNCDKSVSILYQKSCNSLNEALELYFTNPIPIPETSFQQQEEEIIELETKKNKINSYDDNLNFMILNSNFPFTWKRNTFFNSKNFPFTYQKVHYSRIFQQKNIIYVKLTDNYSIYDEVYEFDLSTKTFQISNSNVFDFFKDDLESNKILEINGNIYMVEYQVVFKNYTKLLSFGLLHSNGKKDVLSSKEIQEKTKYSVIAKIASFGSKIFTLFTNGFLVEFDVTNSSWKEISNISEFENVYTYIQHENFIFGFLVDHSSLFKINLDDYSIQDNLVSNQTFKFEKFQTVSHDDFIYLMDESNVYKFNVNTFIWSVFQTRGVFPNFSHVLKHENEIFVFPEEISDSNSFSTEYIYSMNMDNVVIEREEFDVIIKSHHKTDTVIYFNDKKSQLNVHRCVVSHSPILREMIKTSNEIELNEYSESSIIEMLAYLYTNSMYIKDVDSMFELISLSKKFELVEMEKWCYIHLYNFLTHDNAEEIYQKSKLSEDFKFIYQFILEHPDFENEEKTKNPKERGLIIERKMNSLEYFDSIVDNGNDSDLEISTFDHKKLKVHRFFLDMNTDYFNSKGAFIYEPFEYINLKLFYRFMVRRKIDQVSDSQMKKIYEILVHFKCEKLGKRFRKFIQKSMNDDNMFDFFSWSSLNSFDEITWMCERMMKQKHISDNELLKQQTFVDTKIDNIKNKLTQIQSQNQEIISLLKQIQ